MALRLSPHMTVMQNAAQKASKRLLRDFNEVEQLQVSIKGPSDFVSQADLRAEATLREELTKARPGYGFLMEESGASGSDNWAWRWVVDPLDGTTNFLHGIPHWAVSIALEKDGEVIAGVVYDPLRDEMFLAEKGTGAFVTNKRLRVSARDDLSQSLIVTGGASPGTPQYTTFMTELNAVAPYVSATRRLGAASLDICYVAAGRFEGFWERDLKPWDVAAGALIAKEAGGKATDIAGGKEFVYGGSIVVGNGSIHGQLLKRLQSTDSSPKVKSAS